MKIILSSFGTYYSLNQAKLFHKNGSLVKYITGVPGKYIDNQEEIPREKILCIKFPFLINYLCNKFQFILGKKLYSAILKYCHNSFSRSLAKSVFNYVYFYACWYLWNINFKRT